MNGAKQTFLAPALATGRAAEQSIRILLRSGIPKESIKFTSIAFAPERIERLEELKKVTLIIAFNNEKLNSSGLLFQGLEMQKPGPVESIAWR